MKGFALSYCTLFCCVFVIWMLFLPGSPFSKGKEGKVDPGMRGGGGGVWL